jgi:hypothetical protein
MLVEGAGQTAIQAYVNKGRVWHPSDWTTYNQVQEKPACNPVVRFHSVLMRAPSTGMPKLCQNDDHGQDHGEVGRLLERSPPDPTGPHGHTGH